MGRSFRRAATGVVALVSALILAACSSPTGTPGGDSGSENSVTLYSGRNEALVQPVLDMFTDSTGIKVDVRYGSTAAMAAQLLEEGERTNADVFLAQDAGALGAVAKAGMFEALPQETLDKVPAKYRDAEGRWVGVTGRSRVLIYNETLVQPEQLPASVFDLTKPEWKGQIGVAPTNASFQSFITAMRVQHGEERTKEFLAGLAANEPQIRENNGTIVSDVEAGAYQVGLVNHYYIWAKAAELGVPVEQLNSQLYFFPSGDTGALVNVSGVGLMTDPDDADGQALIDYLLSPEAQTYFAEETHEYPLVAGVPTAEGLKPLDSLEPPNVDLNDLDELDQTVEMIKESGLL